MKLPLPKDTHIRNKTNKLGSAEGCDNQDGPGQIVTRPHNLGDDQESSVKKGDFYAIWTFCFCH